MEFRQWLLDFAHQLDSVPAKGKAKRKYYGFDISSAQFPNAAVLESESKKHEIEFSAHNIMDPFPPQYHGYFDVVHVRFLVVGLRQDQVATAVKNVIELLSKSRCHSARSLRLLN